MTTASFFTIQTLAPGQPAFGAAKTAGVTGTPDSALGGLGFLDMILARLAETEKAAQTTVPKAPTDKGALQSSNPALAKDPSIDMAALIAENPEIADQIKLFSTDAQTDLSQTLALNQKAFDAILKPLLNEDGTITVDGKTINLNLAKNSGSAEQTGFKFIDSFMLDETGENKTALEKLKAAFEKIESLNQKGVPVYVATNLTPEQITSLKQQIENILSGKTDEAQNQDGLAGIYIGLVSIVPPQTSSDASPQLALIISQQDQGGSQTEQQLAAKLNALISEKTSGGEKIAAETPAPGDSELPEDFGDVLRNVSGKKAETPSTPGTATNNNDKPSVKADLSTLQNWRFNPSDTTLSTSPLSGTDLPDGMGGAAHGYTITSLGNAVNLVQNTQGAASPHPVMQVVAHTFQKAAAEGESKNILLQLDPPELGRIEIRMSFAKDKSLKATMIAEKPETVSMLQRDAHILERALTDAGIDANGAMSFELAQEGYDFNHKGGHDGNGPYANANDGDEASQVIESTMTWHVDPNTGHMRYNIVV